MMVPLGTLGTGELAEIVGFRRTESACRGPLSCGNGEGRHLHGGRGLARGSSREGRGQRVEYPPFRPRRSFGAGYLIWECLLVKSLRLRGLLL